MDWNPGRVRQLVTPRLPHRRRQAASLRPRRKRRNSILLIRLLHNFCIPRERGYSFVGQPTLAVLVVRSSTNSACPRHPFPAFTFDLNCRPQPSGTDFSLCVSLEANSPPRAPATDCSLLTSSPSLPFVPRPRLC